MSGRIQNEDVKSVAELTGAGGTAAQLPNDDKVYVTALGINKTLKQAIIDEDIGAPPVATIEDLSLLQADIDAGFIDLGAEALPNFLIVNLVVEEKVLIPTIHYSTSVVGLVTRITFLGKYSQNGDSALVEGDRLLVQYIVI